LKMHLQLQSSGTSSPYRARQGSPGGCVCSRSGHCVHCCFSPARTQGSRNQGVDMGVVALPIHPRNSLANFLVSVLMTSWSAGLNVLAPERRCFHQGTQDSTELEVRASSWPLGLLTHLSQQAEKGVPVLADLTTIGKPDFCSTMESYVWNAGDP
jgi:hypothetical protein